MIMSFKYICIVISYFNYSISSPMTILPPLTLEYCPLLHLLCKNSGLQVSIDTCILLYDYTTNNFLYFPSTSLLSLSLFLPPSIATVIMHVKCTCSIRQFNYNLISSIMHFMSLFQSLYFFLFFLLSLPVSYRISTH